jgi:hypothetical protein
MPACVTALSMPAGMSSGTASSWMATVSNRASAPRYSLVVGAAPSAPCSRVRPVVVGVATPTRIALPVAGTSRPMNAVGLRSATTM